MEEERLISKLLGKWKKKKWGKNKETASYFKALRKTGSIKGFLEIQ